MEITFGHTLLAHDAYAKGFNQLDVNPALLLAYLDDTEAILAEPIQTVKRCIASPISTDNKAFNARRKILLRKGCNNLLVNWVLLKKKITLTDNDTIEPYRQSH